MKITKEQPAPVFILELSDRELKTLVSALATSNLDTSSKLMVAEGEEPTYKGAGGDDLHYQLYETLKNQVGW